MDEGKAVDVVYLDFSKAFDTVSHSILLGKLAAHGLDRYNLLWVRIWLEGRGQWVVVNGVTTGVVNGVPAEVQLVTHFKWCPSGVDTGAHLV